VKLEVERIRLLALGDAVALSEVESGRPSPDVRLNCDGVRGTVQRLLGCIEHIFERSGILQETYGLRPTTPRSGGSGMRKGLRCIRS
jgi:Prion-inhibition and propagation